MNTYTLRKWMIGVWLLVLFSAIGILFWYNSWVYLIPTPIPQNYKPVPVGSVLSIQGLTPEHKPTLLHFYNPDCPCSRFNLTHFRSLVKAYQSQVNFVVVVMSSKNYSIAAIQERIGLALPVLFEKSVAEQCGVYSTPQAVLLTSEQQLFYRGNYNRSRYCTDEQTSYAKMALAKLVNHRAAGDFDALALKAYGCVLPVCQMPQ